MMKVKRCISMLLAMLMIMSAFSSLSFATLTYTYGEFNAKASGLSKTSTADEYYPTAIPAANYKTESVKTYAQLAEEYGETDRWYYLGVEIYEKNGADWELTDHYLTAGQEVKFKYYIKGDVYATASMLYFYFSNEIFNSIDGSSVVTDPSSITWNSESPLYTLGAPGTTGQSAIHPNAKSYANTKNLNSQMPESVLEKQAALLIMTGQGSGVYYAKLDSDEPVIEFTTTVKSDVADGTIGYAFYDEGIIVKGKNYIKWSMEVPAENSTCQGTCDKSLTETAIWYTNDCNHAFVIGEPGAAAETVTATFKNYDGTVLDTVEVDSGATPVYSGTTPTKEADAQYSYTFSGWDPALGNITEDTTYTAQFDSTVNEYAIKFVNDDNTELQNTNVAYGTVPTYTGATPTKAEDENYTYTFAGWDSEIVAVTGDATYTATYTSTPKTKSYTITFKNEDGTILQSGSVAEGTLPVYGEATPTKAATVDKTYTFKGWDSEIVEATADAVYTATFNEEARKYTITFKNDDDTVYEEVEVAYGETPTPTKDNPTKADDATYSYTFAGWTPTVEAVTGDATYTATYTASPLVTKYAITFKDGETTDVKQVAENTSAADLAGYAPAWTKTGYTLSWSPALATVTGDATYEAVWTPVKQTIKFVDGDNTEEVELDYDSTAAAVEAEAPAWTKTGYDLSWDKEFAAVTGDATYTAVWTAQLKKITFKDDDFGNETSVQDVAYDTSAEDLAKVAPKWTKNGYSLSWTPALAAVDGDATYTAVWTAGACEINYYVKKGADGAEEFYQKIEGVTDEEVGAKKVTAPDYTSTGWELKSTSTEPEKFGGEIDKVVFTYGKIDYTINFYNDTDKEDLYKTFTKNYGDEIEVDAPTKAGYNFKGWTPEVATVSGSADYVATWEEADQTAKFYINDTDKTAWKEITKKYNEEYTLDEDPTKAGYIFQGWTKGETTLTLEDKGENGFALTMGIDDVYVANWKLDTAGSKVSSIAMYEYKTVLENPEASYYDVDLASYKVVFTEGCEPINLIITDANNNQIIYSAPSFEAVGSASGITTIGKDGNKIFWIFEAVLGEGTYSVQVEMYNDEGELIKDTANQLVVTFAEKKAASSEDADITSAAVSAATVVTGNKLVWTVAASEKVYYIKVVTKCADDSEYTNLYKQGTTGVDGFKYEDGTWTIPVIYSTSADSEAQTTTILYKYANSTKWMTYYPAGEDEAFSKAITVTKVAAIAEEVLEKAAVKLQDKAAGETALELAAGKGKIEITVPADATRVRVVWEQNGAKKNAAYQGASSTVTVTENEDGTKTWTSTGFKYVAGVTSYTIQYRVTDWVDLTTVDVTVS